MKKRIFTAIKVSPDLENKVSDWQKNQSGLNVRWIAPKNLHITLVPPWYAEESQIANLEARLAETAKNTKAFKIKFHKISFGPDPKHPRLIWAEGDAPEAAIRFKEDAERIFGTQSEYRPWKIHLTVARFKEEDFADFSVKKLDEKIFWPENVNGVVLMESRLLKSGADYLILCTAGFADLVK